MNVIDEIKRQSLLQYIGGQPERCGSNVYRISPCPLCGHNDCFTVYDNSNTYKCFSCGKSGSIIDFVIDKGEAWDVAAAIEKLCQVFNIEKPKPEHSNAKAQSSKDAKVKRDRIKDIFNFAAEFYHKQLMANKTAQGYLREKRKRSERLWSELKYGYAVSRGALTAALTKAGFTAAEQLASGLVKVKEDDGSLYDLFGNGVIVYPGFIGKDVVDFSCKPIDKEKANAYQLPTVNKLRNCMFYGQDAIYNKEYVLVEGQEDRNAIIDAGYRQVVSIIGQISERQLDFLADKAGEDSVVYCCFDTDQAGKKYAIRVGEALIGKACVRYIKLSDGFKDVDEWLRSLPQEKKSEAWAEAMEQAEDLVYHLIKGMPDEIGDLDPFTAKLHYDPILKLLAKVDDNLALQRYLIFLSAYMGNKTEWLSHFKSAIRKLRKEDDIVEEEVASGKRSIIKDNNKYWKITDKEVVKPVSEFIINITRYIEVEGLRHYEVVLINSTGLKSKPFILNNEQRINMRQFDAAIAGVGSYYFYGSLNDLKEIWQIEEAESNIKSYTCIFRRYGYIKDHKVWLFKNCAYKNGKMYVPEAGSDIIEVDNIGYLSEGVKVYGGDFPELCTTVKPTEEVVHRTIELFLDMWDATDRGGYPYRSFKGFMALGYVAAVVYLREIVEKERKFPYVLAYGPPGTGKSEAMQFVMNIFGFRNGGENWGEATSAGIGQAMDQLSALPYCIEEFSNAVGASSFQQKKVELLKNMYNRVSSGKGGVNNNRLVYEVNAAAMLIGQDRPENQALLSRCVVLRKEKPVEKGSQAYYELKAKNKELSLVLRWLIEGKSKQTVATYWEVYNELMQILKERIRRKTGDYNERTAANFAIFAAAFKLFNYSLYEKEFVDWIVDECIADMSRKQAEDLIYKFIESIEVCFTHNLGEVVRKEGNYVFIYYNYCYNEWIKNLKATGMQEYIGREGLVDYLRKDPAGYWIEPEEQRGFHRKYFGNKQQRCIGLTINLLPAHIKEVVESWDVKQEFGG